MDLKTLGSTLKSYIDLKSNVLSVKVESSVKGKEIFFACYLMAGKSVVQKKSYERGGFFEFELLKAGIYSLKVYILDRKENIRTHKVFNLGLIYVSSSYYNSKFKSYSNERRLGLGSEFFLKKSLKFSSYESFNIVGVDELYNLDPYSSSTWKWWLFQLEHIVYLIAYLDSNKTNDIVLQEVINNIVEFSDFKNEVSSKSNKMLWHDHATALRLKNLTFIFQYLVGNRFILSGETIYGLILDLIKEHIAKLMDECFYSKHTNHGFDQAIYLYQSALELEYILKLNNEIVIAEERILDEILFAFCADGGHKENSPAYLNFGVKQCLMVLDVMKRYNRENVNVYRIKDIVDKSTEVLAFITRPDGYLPLIGDTSLYKVTDIFGVYKPNNYPLFKYSITKGLSGVKPNKNNLILEEAGYAIYRSTWNQECFLDSVFLTLKAGYKSNYHRHDDDLSITLFAYNEDWFIDGGIYKYNEKDKHRKYIRSHLSHNILSPLGVDANRGREYKHEVFLKLNEQQQYCDFNVTATSKMFNGYIVQRNILINKLEEIQITDTCENERDEDFTPVSRFFVCPEKKITISGNTVLIEGLNKTLELVFYCDLNLDIKMIEARQDKVVGWLSNRSNSLFQAKLIEIKTEVAVGKFELKVRCKFI